MKFTRSMVLVSNDPESMRKGAAEVYSRFQEELAAFGLSEEISLAQIAGGGREDALPMVIIYPEASVYGPVSAGNVKRIVEEHLYKGRVVEDLLVPVRNSPGKSAG